MVGVSIPGNVTLDYPSTSPCFPRDLKGRARAPGACDPLTCVQVLSAPLRRHQQHHKRRSNRVSQEETSGAESAGLLITSSSLSSRCETFMDLPGVSPPLSDPKASWVLCSGLSSRSYSSTFSSLPSLLTFRDFTLSTVLVLLVTKDAGNGSVKLAYGSKEVKLDRGRRRLMGMCGAVRHARNDGVRDLDAHGNVRLSFHQKLS
eukprot:750701-Hanusia_phi.AAC.8